MNSELTKAAQQALEALEDARDDVETARQQAAQLIGYPRTDARHASYVAQLEKHDAAIDALRTALTQRPAAQTEREAFESELAKMPDWAPECEKHRPWVEWILWVFWQARASLPTPQQATPEPVGYLYDFTVDRKTCTDWYTSAAEWSGVAKDGVSNVRPLVYGYTRPAAAPAVPDGFALISTGLSWDDCLLISENPDVDEALRLFADGETTADQAVCIVQSVLSAAQAKGVQHG